MALLLNQELEKRLSAAGKSLLHPPSSPDQLLTLLDQIEELLANVAQSPSKSMNIALGPLMNALISEELLKHSDVDLQVAVVACISEITRITAPEAPYDDDKMKDIFQLIVSSFEKLWDTSSRSYKKRANILGTVAKVRTCVIMLDLELDQMIIEMLEHFLKSIRVHHAEVIFSSMMSIMTLVLEESEDKSPDLLSPILNALKKNNEAVSLTAKALVTKVIQDGADKFGRHLAKVVNTLNVSLDDYNEIVASIIRRNITSQLPDETVGAGVKEESNPDKKDNDMDAQIPQLEVKEKHAANGEVSLSNRILNSAESSDLIDDEKQADRVPGNKEIPSEEIHILPCEAPSVEAEKPLDTIKDVTIQVSIVKEAENEAVNIASPIQSSFPDENRPKNSSRTKKKQMVKEDTACTKASEDTHVGEVNKKRRTMRRGVTLNEGAPKNDAAAMSDSEAGDLNSGELGDTTKMKEDKCLLKEDRRRVGLEKPMSEEDTSFEEDTSKYSTRDLEKNKEASLSLEKSAEEEVTQEETPRTGSKRKRSFGTGNTPKTIQYGKNLIGSKVKVWWPDDKKFYEGVIKSYHHKKKRHMVKYIDGDVEILNLRKEEWEFVNDDSVLDSDHGIESTEPAVKDASSDKKKKKVPSNSKTSNKREKMDDPPKRKRGRPPKSSNKSKDDGKAEPESPGNSEDESDKSEYHPEEFEDKTPTSSAKVSGRPRTRSSRNHPEKFEDKTPSSSAKVSGRPRTRSSRNHLEDKAPSSFAKASGRPRTRSSHNHPEEFEDKTLSSSAKASGRTRSSHNQPEEFEDKTPSSAAKASGRLQTRSSHNHPKEFEDKTPSVSAKVSGRLQTRSSHNHPVEFEDKTRSSSAKASGRPRTRSSHNQPEEFEDKTPSSAAKASGRLRTRSSHNHLEEFEDKPPCSSAKASGRPQTRSSYKKQDVKLPFISEGKFPQSGRTGRKRTKKSNSSKGNEAVRMEKTTGSVKSPDSVKSAKSPESGNKSGKRKRK